MSARTTLAEHLTTELPATKYRVIDYPDFPGNLTKPLVMVFGTDITRYGQIGHDRLEVGVVVWLIVPNENPAAAEDALDDGVGDLIDALEPLDWCSWDTAERLTYGPPEGPFFHGYKFTLTCLAQIGD